MPDPAGVEGTDDQKRRAFLAAYATLSNRINLLLALPAEQLERISLKRNLDEIAKR